MASQQLFQIKFEKRKFVGYKLDCEIDQKPEDVITQCLTTHRNLLKVWFGFTKETAINPLAVIPSTIAKFSENKVERYCGFIFDSLSLADQFKKFSDTLIEYDVPEQTFFMMTHFGEITGKDDAWRLLLGYCAQNNIDYDKTWSYESYPVNETMTKETKVWETEIYQPLLTPLTEVPQDKSKK
jgi:predicted transcriptional regulator YdeE